MDNLIECLHCNKFFSKYGIRNHIFFKHTEEGKKIDKFGSSRGWSKGLTKENDSRIAKQAKTYKDKLNSGEIIHSFKGKNLTKEHKEKISKSIAQNGNHNGGYKKVPYINYMLKNGKEIKLRGSYEIRLATYLDKNNIEWEYQKPISYINKNNEIKHMLPDFFIPSLNKYFDTKGYLTNDCKNKINLIKQQKNIDIHLIFLKELEKLESGLIQLMDL